MDIAHYSFGIGASEMGAPGHGECEVLRFQRREPLEGPLRDGTEYDYISNVAAAVAAIKAARSAASYGYEAEVLLQGVDMKWRTEWASE